MGVCQGNRNMSRRSISFKVKCSLCLCIGLSAATPNWSHSNWPVSCIFWCAGEKSVYTSFLDNCKPTLTYGSVVQHHNNGWMCEHEESCELIHICGFQAETVVCTDLQPTHLFPWQVIAHRRLSPVVQWLWKTPVERQMCTHCITY